jgi:hypothetical protein
MADDILDQIEKLKERDHLKAIKKFFVVSLQESRLFDKTIASFFKITTQP